MIRDASPEFTEGNQQVKLGPGLEAYTITEPRFWRTPVSPTFHGRDIFAPVAAHLSLGRSPADFGERITALATLPLTRPYKEADGSVVGHIIHIDTFGDLITDITSEDLPSEGKQLYVKISNQTIDGLSRTYTEGEGLLALIGSSNPPAAWSRASDASCNEASAT